MTRALVKGKGQRAKGNVFAVDELISAGHAIDVREGDPQRDSIDGVVPRLVLEPRNPESVAAALAWASEHRLSVLIEGAGTNRAWGRRPERIDVALSMRQLNRVLAFEPGDLTVTAEAGLSLGELNQMLRARGQQLTLDPPHWDRATIGGLLATNDSGPTRHRFGTPRDLVIGVQLATADGRLAKAGGQVVKNVAGYDLSKLIAGSFGGLAAIVSATFKLAPTATNSKTAVITVEHARLPDIVSAISSTQLEPHAFEIHVTIGASGPTGRCLVRFASVAAAVNGQLSELARVLASFRVETETVGGEEEARLWQAHSLWTTHAGEALVRASWLPADLGRVLALLDRISSGADVEMVGRAAVGAGLIRLRGDARHQVSAIEYLRESNAVGNVVVRSASPDVKASVDVWGSAPTALLVSVKRAVDPHGVLGAGRGLV